MIHLYEDTLNALLDLADVDGTKEMMRAVFETLQTLQMALSEGELAESELHSLAYIESVLAALRPHVDA